MVLFTLFILLATVNFHVASNVLRITNFYVPRIAYKQVAIECKYDLAGGKLYDVKWYKDEEEFFRCRGDDKVQEFPIEGLMISHSNLATAGSCPLTLIALTPKSSAEYKCEVTLDEPGFPFTANASRLDLLMPLKRTQDSSNGDASSGHTLEDEMGSKSSGCRTVELKNALVVWLIYLYILNYPK